MKNAIMISATLLPFLILGCGESELENAESFELSGTYIGTLASSASINETAKGEISFMADDQIAFHCYSANFDSTVVLNLYEHRDTVNVCLAGDDFEREYGHRMGQHHMMHGTNTFETNWGHHLSDEHNQGDRHYGFYHNNSQMFHFTFRINDHQQNYELTFEGVKQ